MACAVYDVGRAGRAGRADGPAVPWARCAGPRPGRHHLRMLAMGVGAIGICWILAAMRMLRALIGPTTRLSSSPSSASAMARRPHRDGTVDDEDRHWFEQTQREMTVSAGPGLRLRAVVLDPDRADAGAHRYLICCHSRTGTVQNLAAVAHRFARMGCTVILPVGRGGPGEGRYLGMGLLESHDLLRWIHEVLVHDSQARIVLDGASMGAAAVMLACGSGEMPGQVIGAIAECGYVNAYGQLVAVIRQRLRAPQGLAHAMAWTVNAVCRLRAGYDLRDADCLAAMRHTHVPMLFVNAQEDRVVDPADADRLVRACASAVRERVTIPNARHAACADDNPERYWPAVEGFVRTLPW